MINNKNSAHDYALFFQLSRGVPQLFRLGLIDIDGSSVKPAVEKSWWEAIIQAMKNIRQFGIILTVTCIGEILRYFIPLPVPASIYGLLLMLFLLVTGIVRVDKVKEAGGFLIEIMPMMFIPAAVGLMASWELLRPVLFKVLVIIVVSTFLVIGVTGLTAQKLMKGAGDE